MFHLRRAAARTFSSQSPAFLAKPRSLVTQTPAALRQRQLWQAPSFQRRFASDEASPTQAQTSGETVTTEPSESEIKAKEEAQEHVENKAEASESDAQEALGLPKSPEEAVEAVKEKFQQAASTAASTARSAADAVLGGSSRSSSSPSSRRADSGTFSQPTPGKILYVGNLFFEVKAPQLEQEFAKYGSIVNCKIVQDERGLSKGFGYVEFDKIEDAAAALEALNQRVFHGRRFAVQYHVRREPRISARPTRNAVEPTKTLFIGNMSFQMSDKDLNDLFRDVRNVLDVRVAIDRRSGQPRGFAHADFVDVASAETAKKFLEDKEIYGRRLRVDYSVSTPAADRGDRKE